MHIGFDRVWGGVRYQSPPFWEVLLVNVEHRSFCKYEARSLEDAFVNVEPDPICLFGAPSIVPRVLGHGKYRKGKIGGVVIAIVFLKTHHRGTHIGHRYFVSEMQEEEHSLAIATIFRNTHQK